YPTAGDDAGVDGLAGDEGAFLACSFWLADDLAMIGRVDEARTLFEKLLALRNDLGLLAEEWDPHLKRQVGNFQQALSLFPLLDSARALTPKTPVAARPVIPRQRPAHPTTLHIAGDISGDTGDTPGAAVPAPA
ncbi:glycoside hydrolase family 15 protein, partial [Streptomyces uncialis]|uniref:glycoside hydrolase family 15 protein n=1 Tax=Streptomyces uncialis TaxID=1048205 RepID=UPI0033F6118A